jgi:hypothetical protein
MPYRLLPTIPTLTVLDPHGRQVQHLQRTTDPWRGPIIRWLRPDQAAEFLRIPLVEEITDAEVTTALRQAGVVSGETIAQAANPHPRTQLQPSAEQAGDDYAMGNGTAVTPELVEDCIRTLDQFRDPQTGDSVPSSAGRPTCTTALRQSGVSFSNETIAQAVKQRKMRQPTTSEG